MFIRGQVFLIHPGYQSPIPFGKVTSWEHKPAMDLLICFVRARANAAQAGIRSLSCMLSKESALISRLWETVRMSSKVACLAQITIGRPVLATTTVIYRNLYRML